MSKYKKSNKNEIEKYSLNDFIDTKDSEVKKKSTIKNMTTMQYILKIPYSVSELVNGINSINVSEKKYKDNINTNDITCSTCKGKLNYEYEYSPLEVTYSDTSDVYDLKVYRNNILPEIPEFLSDSYDEIKVISTQKTDIACWWCCHQFDTFPISAPMMYNHKLDIFTTIGCFCSFNCAKAYLVNEEKTDMNKQYLTSYLYKKITGKLKSIKPAPHRQVIRLFGGPMNISEYRKTFDTLTDVSIYKYPMTFISNSIVVKKYKAMKDSKKNINEVKLHAT